MFAGWRGFHELDHARAQSVSHRTEQNAQRSRGLAFAITGAEQDSWFTVHDSVSLSCAASEEGWGQVRLPGQLFEVAAGFGHLFFSTQEKAHPPKKDGPPRTGKTSAFPRRYACERSVVS